MGLLAQLVLDDAAAGVLDASGNQTVTIGPKRSRQRWLVENIAVAATSNTKEPLCVVYQGFPADANRIGGTYTGSNDSIPVNLTLRNGNFISARWTGGDVGATVTVSVYGQIILDA